VAASKAFVKELKLLAFSVIIELILLDEDRKAELMSSIAQNMMGASVRTEFSVMQRKSDEHID
jgi:hypothetical protein